MSKQDTQSESSSIEYEATEMHRIARGFAFWGIAALGFPLLGSIVGTVPEQVSHAGALGLVLLITAGMMDLVIGFQVDVLLEASVNCVKGWFDAR